MLLETFCLAELRTTKSLSRMEFLSETERTKWLNNFIFFLKKKRIWPVALEKRPFSCQRTWRSSDHPEGRYPAKSKPRGHHAERAAVGSQDCWDFTFCTSAFRAMTETSQLKVCIFIINKPHLPEKKMGKSRSRGEVIAGKLRHRVSAAERGWGRQQG